MVKNKIKINKGFTLIEMLIVIGIVALLALLVSFTDISSFRRKSFHSEVDSLGRALQAARIRALNNINQESHRVALTSLDYDLVFDPSSPSEIVFGALSGDSNYEGDIKLMDLESNMTTVISINHEGRISW